MARRLVTCTFKMPDLQKRLESSEKRIQKFLAAQLQTNRGFLFNSEGAYNGHKKWKPLKYRQGRILQLSGVLRRSIAPMGASGIPGAQGKVTFKGGKKNPGVTLSTSVKYAAIHNFGGVVKRGTTKFKMPKRNFTDLNKKDISEITKALKNLIARVLNGR